MALSGSFDFTVTRDDIITDAIRELGAIDIDESPSTAEVTFAARKLNILLKSLQKEHIFIHTLGRETFNTVIGTGAYNSAAGTHRILDAFITVGNVDLSISIRPMDYYDELPLKDVTGIPTDLYVDPASNVFNLFPVPDQAYVVTYQLERSFQDFDSSTNNADFPITGARLLIKGLAMELAPAYRISTEERMVLKQEYGQEKSEYLAGNTQRTGREIVVPIMVV